MDHSAVLSSRVANLVLIEEEEDSDTPQPSSPQFTPNGQSSSVSTSSEFVRPSGTPDDIPKHKEVESITTLDECFDARSQIFPISSSTLKSSFYRMASASQESITSVRSMLFAPSFGTLNVNIRQLVQYLRSKRSISKAEILNMTTYQCRSAIKHMFVVLQLKQGDTESWLRLDRRVEDPLNTSFLFSSMQGPAKDVAKAASKLEELIEASDVKEHSRIVFEEPPLLKVLESFLVAIYEESKDYRIWPENCWFFCSLMQEHLSHRHGGHFAFGELYRPTLGSDARARISGRLDGMKPADLSVSRSLSLLYRVVRRPSMASAVVATTNLSPYPYLLPQYLLFMPDGSRILHGSYDGIIRVWDLSLRELIIIPAEDPSQVGDWARLLDHRIIVSGSSEGSYNFWDATSGTSVRFCTASRGSEGIDFRYLSSAPDNLTAQGWERVIHDADRWQGDPQVRNEMHNRVACTSVGSILVDEKSSNIRIANLYVGPRLAEDHMLSPSGKSFSFRLRGSNDSYLWNIDTQTVYRFESPYPPRDYSGSRFYSRSWSPDGHYIAIEWRDDITIWDTRTGALVSILNLGSVFGGLLRFSPDGRYFVVADGSQVKLWDMKVALLHGPYRSNRPLPIHNDMVDFSQ